VKGNVRHCQCMRKYVSLSNANPLIISLLEADRMTFVIAAARRSICRETLFDASQGLRSR
jgi:hypothetical protein